MKKVLPFKIPTGIPKDCPHMSTIKKYLQAEYPDSEIVLVSEDECDSIVENELNNIFAELEEYANEFNHYTTFSDDTLIEGIECCGNLLFTNDYDIMEKRDILLDNIYLSLILLNRMDK